MWGDLRDALAVMLVLEGLLPFLSPATLRRTLVGMLAMRDGALRVMGLASMLAGLVLLYAFG